MLAGDLQYYYPAVRTRLANNGGRLSAARITSGAPACTFPDVFSAERAVETEYWEKVFPKIHSDSAEKGMYPKIFLDGDAAQGDDWCYFIVGTQRNTQGDIAGTEQKYTAGDLRDSVVAGGQTIIVTVKDTDQTAMFYNGGTIRISDKVPFNGSGNEQYLTVDQEPSVSGLDVTLHVAETLSNNFASGSIVSMVYEPASAIEATLDTTSYTGGANGDFDAITLNNMGTVEQDWTGTMDDATNYTLVGDELGSVGSSSIGADFSPQHATHAKPLLTIPASFFDGLTLSPGDTFSFSTHPAAVPIWEYHNNPVDAAVTNANSLWLIMRVEAAS